MAEIISLAAALDAQIKKGRRKLEEKTQEAIELMTERLTTARPDLDPQTCRTLATKQITGRLPWLAPPEPEPEPQRPPLLAPDDPLFDLFDAFKEAQTRYHEQLRRRAEQHRMSVKQFAARMGADRRRYRKTTGGCWDGCPDGVLPI